MTPHALTETADLAAKYPEGGCWRFVVVATRAIPQFRIVTCHASVQVFADRLRNGWPSGFQRQS